jgi:hypothetical protein
MDIRALIHKPAEAVVIHACRIRHVYLLCFVLMTFLVPWQLGAMTDSDEEMQLINDVALLDSRLRKAACPCDETMFAHLFRDFDAKPFAKRLKLWQFRKDMRQTLLDDMLSHPAPSATAGEIAAASPPVVEQETERKRKFEEPPVVANSAQPKDNGKLPVFSYTQNHKGSAPLMSPLHVEFTAKSVERLRKSPLMTGPELIELWNKDWDNGLITAEITCSQRGHSLYFNSTEPILV